MSESKGHPPCASKGGNGPQLELVGGPVGATPEVGWHGVHILVDRGSYPGRLGTKIAFCKRVVFECSKRGEETVKKLEEIFLDVRAITGENKSVVRFHSDAGKEFLNQEMKKILDAKGIFQRVEPDVLVLGINASSV